MRKTEGQTLVMKKDEARKAEEQPLDNKNDEVKRLQDNH